MLHLRFQLVRRQRQMCIRDRSTAKLLLHCPDTPGILADVTNFFTVNKGNIIYLDQYVDHVENIFLCGSSGS